MNVQRITLPAFSIIGIEGSTRDGADFIPRLWAEANARFAEVAPLARKRDSGALAGFWGAMTDFSRSFLPWQNNFTEGLYLAGVECPPEAEPPAGWTKWTVPGFEYLCTDCDGPDTFPMMLALLAERGLSLAGAVHDYTCPETGQNRMYFPIRRL